MHVLMKNVRVSFDLDSLAASIARGKSVVYTGAGASMPAGLPGWDGFLRECLQRAEHSLQSNERWEQAAKLLREGDYLTSAGILQREIGQSLEQYVWERFGTAKEPTEIHRAIARIPFSLAITTNYDRLLESAYPKRPNVWTWRDPEALFSSIKHRRFAVVKIHGDVGNGPSLVLTKNQYRDLMHLNRAFNECLTSLLSLRTFFFVGSSIRDRDLIQLMDAAKLTYGADFGPHYAIVFADEVDDALARLLRDAYNLQCIICDKPDAANGDWRTAAVCSVLKVLSGRVAKLSAQEIPLSRLERPSFSLRSFSQDLTRFTVSNTAADRGLIAFVRDPKLPSLYCLARTPHSGSTIASKGHTVYDPSKRIAPVSFLGKQFLKYTSPNDYVYIDDVEQQATVNTSDIYSDQSSTQPHSDTKSILTVPIYADGAKVGILSIESTSRDAFTADHLAALRSGADTAGAMFVEYQHRQAMRHGVLPYMQRMEVFQQLMQKSRELRPLEISYLLYEIDYGSGRMIAHYDETFVKVADPSRGTGFNYAFEDRSLATHVLRDRKIITIEDAAADLLADKPLLAAEGVRFFNIAGAVFAAPIRVHGHISTVLVCWSRLGKNGQDKPGTLQFGPFAERIVRLATLVANSPDRFGSDDAEIRQAYQFIDDLNKQLTPVDLDKNWSPRKFFDEKFRRRIIHAALSSLLEDSCGLKRVRLWICDHQGKDGFQSFRLCYGLSRISADANAPISKKIPANCVTDTDDRYCAYTVARSLTDPHTQFQHREMFGEPDRNAGCLAKDIDGSWLVGPILYSGKLVGFISADNHIDAKELKISEELAEFQRCAVDLITDLIEPIVGGEVKASLSARK